MEDKLDKSAQGVLMYWSRPVPVVEARDIAPPSAKMPKRVRLYFGLMALDCLCMIAAFLLASAITNREYLPLDGLTLAAMAMPIYLAIASNGQSYGIKMLRTPIEAALNAFIHMGVTMFGVTMVLYLAHASTDTSRLSFLIGITLSAVFVAAVRKPYAAFAHRSMKGTLTNEIVILDDAHMPTDPHAYVVNAQEINLTPDLNDPYMLDRLGRWLRCFDRAIIACPADRREVWSLILRGANINGEIVVPEINLSGAIGIGAYNGQQTQIVSQGPLGMANRAKKRLFDLALTVPTLLALTPLLALIALAIKLESKGPVLFVQKRVGRANALFNIYKFRSMRVEQCDANGMRSASRDDDRITKVGRILRGTSLDELPQLFNVLLGDMSLVGPRPHALGSKADNKPFWEISPLYWCRHSLKPGITGLAQVRGFRGATETAADIENRLGADLEYIQHWSLAHEFLILLNTVRVLVHKNAF